MFLHTYVNRCDKYNASDQENSTGVDLNIFPSHMTQEIWVEAHNKLETTDYEHMIKDADCPLSFFKKLPQGVLEILSSQEFTYLRWQSPWPLNFDHQTQSVHPSVEVSICVKFEGIPSRHSKDIEFTRMGRMDWWTTIKHNASDHGCRHCRSITRKCA